jgi:hypothetical protein
MSLISSKEFMSEVEVVKQRSKVIVEQITQQMKKDMIIKN